MKYPLGFVAGLGGYYPKAAMRPLFSTLADRLPSHGLLFLRLIVAIVVIARCANLPTTVDLPTITLRVSAAVAAAFLLFGLWTRAAGVMVALVELLMAFSHPHDLWLSVLLAGLGVALAMLGPGAWSLDARRSGWKRIEIRRPED